MSLQWADSFAISRGERLALFLTEIHAPCIGSNGSSLDRKMRSDTCLPTFEKATNSFTIESINQFRLKTVIDWYVIQQHLHNVFAVRCCCNMERRVAFLVLRRMDDEERNVPWMVTMAAMTTR
jgi:hypothetical protein